MGTVLKFRKVKENSSSLAYVHFHKTWNLAFSQRSRVVKLLFLQIKHCSIFAVLVAVAFVVAKAPSFGSTTQYNMNRKTIRLILAVSAEHREI